MPRTTIVAVVFASCAAIAAGQTPPPASQQTPSQPTFRSGIGVVRVDVTVIDRRGQPVADLTADDFEVRERGVPQPIAWLQYVQISGQPLPGDDTSLAIRSPAHAAQEAARDDVRVLVIFLDDYHLRRGPSFDVRLKELLRGFVRAEMQPTDLFAVAGPLLPVSALDLTRNKEDILDRIARFQGLLGEPQAGPPNRGDIRAQVSLTALQSLAAHLGGLRDARTSVLFVSEGPPLRTGGGSMTTELRDVIKAANTSNVTIHTLDPRALGGVRWGSDVNAALAGETGGRDIGNTNNSSRGLASVIADSSAYYLVGYTPLRDEADGKFHEIDVKVRRKDVKVIARKGYWAPTEAEMQRRPTLPATPADISQALGALTAATRSAATPAPAVAEGPVGLPIVYHASTAAAQRALAAGEELPRTEERRFRRTDRVVVRLPLAAEARGAAVRAELVSVRGQTLAALPVARDSAGLPLVELPLGNVARAEYVLRLTVDVAGSPVTRLLAFAVVP